MRIKSTKIPIYGAVLKIILVEDISQIFDKYNIQSTLVAPSALVFREKQLTYIAAFNTKEVDRGIVVHEVVHVVNMLFQDLGVYLDVENDEPQAYLTEWVFTHIEKIISGEKEKCEGKTK